MRVLRSRISPTTSRRKAVWGRSARLSAPAAAFLNAAFGICLGCQIYPLVAHLRIIGGAPAGTGR